ncbi:MAG: hypothetical protein LBE05_04860 [Microbacterium sp.]|jgi:hypothetical protein|nr:hypothetical protein [Microbacterium sp.]
MGLTTITYTGGSPITPTLVEIDTASYSATARTVVHDILDGPPVHTLRPSAPHRGTLVLLFNDPTRAADCERIHRSASTFTVTSGDQARLNFEYVVTGDVRLEQDQSALNVWHVRVDYQAVS